MNGERSTDKDEDKESEPVDDGAEVVEDFDSTVVMSDDDDDDDDEGLDDSSEVNVDKLVADIEALRRDEKARKQLEARKRIDAMKDDFKEDDEFGSTYNFDLDDDLL